MGSDLDLVNLSTQCPLSKGKHQNGEVKHTDLYEFEHRKVKIIPLSDTPTSIVVIQLNIMPCILYLTKLPTYFHAMHYV